MKDGGGVDRGEETSDNEGVQSKEREEHGRDLAARHNRKHRPSVYSALLSPTKFIRT